MSWYKKIEFKLLLKTESGVNLFLFYPNKMPWILYHTYLFFLIKKKNPWVPHFYLFDFFKQYIISYLSFLLLSVYIIYRLLFHHNIIRISINIYISNVSNYQSSYYFFFWVNESSYYLVISNWCFVQLHCMVLWISTRA